jgi:hypothetical protein
VLPYIRPACQVLHHHVRAGIWGMSCLLCLIQNSSMHVWNVFCKTKCSFAILLQSTSWKIKKKSSHQPCQTK